MSSNKKKQVVPTDKKKFALFNLAKSKEAEKSANKAEASAVEDVTAAVLHSKDTNKPSTSNKGQNIQKITKFFKKGPQSSNPHPMKTSKKANAVVDQPKQPSESDQPKDQETELATSEKSHEEHSTIDYPEGSAGPVEVREKAAAKIQAVYRGRYQRRKYLRERQNVIKVEALARGFLARKQVAGMKASPEAAEETKERTVDATESENLISFT